MSRRVGRSRRETPILTSNMSSSLAAQCKYTNIQNTGQPDF
jgi:hypothetical protein